MPPATPALVVLLALAAACAPRAPAHDPANPAPPAFLIDGHPVHPACVRELLSDPDTGPAASVDAALHAREGLHPGDVVGTPDGAQWTAAGESFSYRHLGTTPSGTHILHTRLVRPPSKTWPHLLWARLDGGLLAPLHEDFLPPEADPVATFDGGTTLVRMRPTGPAIGADPGPILDESWFPLGARHRWVYDSSEGDVVFEVTGAADVNGTRCQAVRRSLAADVSVFYISVSASGVRVHRVDEDVFVPPYLEFAFGTRRGDFWRWEGVIGNRPVAFHVRNDGADDPATPGTLSVSEAMIFPDTGGAGSTWFEVRRGVGVVQLWGKNGDLHNPSGESYAWTLREFSIGGKPVYSAPARAGR